MSLKDSSTPVIDGQPSFVMEILPEDIPAYDKVNEICLNTFNDQNQDLAPVALAEKIMGIPELPFHHPFHHYLVSAVLLTCSYRSLGEDRKTLDNALKIAYERSLKVLKGFCGLYGCCGAAVGLGIAYSILTNTTPLSKKSWSDTNRITGLGLIEMAKYSGPRCCKRNTYIALLQGVAFIRENLKIHLADEGTIHCSFYAKNKECLKENCCFYPL
ncbi:MAG: hypothetical protein GX127_06665 [Eubacteriaceae bacterium]|nr:hypothetical protein [Eubacteriaceae bacterium]